MKFAVASQNFRTVTGHAGKTRRFLVYEAGADTKPVEIDRLDMPREMAMHNYRGDEHPLFTMDVVIVGGCGAGFVQRLGNYGTTVVTTDESDPQQAVIDFSADFQLPYFSLYTSLPTCGQGTPRVLHPGMPVVSARSYLDIMV